MRQFKQRAQGNVSAAFSLHVIADNLIRLGKIHMPMEVGGIRREPLRDSIRTQLPEMPRRPQTGEPHPLHI